MKQCMRGYYDDPEYREQCTQEYLDRRSEYRRTGVGITAESVLKRRQKSEEFMRRIDAEERAKAAEEKMKSETNVKV